MATKYTLTSYDPVYVIAPEVRIPEDAIQQQALRWLELTICEPGEKPKLNDQWIAAHCDDFNTVEELLIFIRYNMYRDHREVQQLADQDVICRELATRLVEDLPEDLVEDSIYTANARLEEMVYRSGFTSLEDFAAQRGITVEQMYEDTKQRAIQSLKEDTALGAYADYKQYTLDAEDFYAVIPGENIQDKAHKRRQIELDGRLAGMEEYARKTKALKEVMDNAMIKRSEHDAEWLRYGDSAASVMEAQKHMPDNFISL